VPEKITLGKAPFAEKNFTERSLPSVTLSKAFAECNMGFAECLGHSAKPLFPVVVTINYQNTPFVPNYKSLRLVRFIEFVMYLDITLVQIYSKFDVPKKKLKRPII
jgi:hypothetical protein